MGLGSHFGTVSGAHSAVETGHGGMGVITGNAQDPPFGHVISYGVPSYKPAGAPSVVALRRVEHWLREARSSAADLASAATNFWLTPSGHSQMLSNVYRFWMPHRNDATHYMHANSFNFVSRLAGVVTNHLTDAVFNPAAGTHFEYEVTLGGTTLAHVFRDGTFPTVDGHGDPVAGSYKEAWLFNPNYAELPKGQQLACTAATSSAVASMRAFLSGKQGTHATWRVVVDMVAVKPGDTGGVYLDDDDYESDYYP